LVGFPLGSDALHQDTGVDVGLNGALVRALTLAMRLAGRRDCFEASLALCKLALSLDPLGDPSLACLCVDYYALRAHQPDWLLTCELANFSPAALPNAAFSRALAYKLLGDARADEALHMALRRFPGFARAVAPETDFGFGMEWLGRRCLEAQDPVVERVVRLGAARLGAVWQQGPHLAWLKLGVLAVAKANAPLLGWPSSGKARDLQLFYSRGVVSDFNDQVAIIPREEAPRPDERGEGEDRPVDNGPGVVQGLIEFLTGAFGLGVHAPGRDTQPGEDAD
jgi:hypothetical protein